MGFCAPGVPKLNYWLLVNEDDDRDVESDQVRKIMKHHCIAYLSKKFSLIFNVLHKLLKKKPA